MTEKVGNFLENDFWTPPPPINFVHDHFLFNFQQFSIHIFRIIGHVAAALGPLACASRSVRPPSLS